MDTFFARNRLSAYLDGDLPLGEAREVEAAIRRDPELRAEYDALRHAVDQLRTHGPTAAPEGFAGRLKVRLAAEPPPSRLRSTLRRVRPEYLGVAAIAALALLFVGTKPEAPAPAPTEVAAAKVASLPPAAEVATAPGGPAAANGVLGDEAALGAAAPAATPSASSAAKPGSPKFTKRGVTESVEKQAFETDWEQKEPAVTAPAPTLYSPAPWRYRLKASGDNPLSELVTLASSLGGRIVDAKGRPIADYPMDEGDSKSVRVIVPSYNVEALQRKLGDLGTLDTIATDTEMLYQNGGDVPVAIEVSR